MRIFLVHHRPMTPFIPGGSTFASQACSVTFSQCFMVITTTPPLEWCLYYSTDMYPITLMPLAMPPLRVTLHVLFEACETLPSTSVNVALDSLQSAGVLIPCIHSFHLPSLNHAIDLPGFPRLMHAYLSLHTSDSNVSPYWYTYLSPVFAPWPTLFWHDPSFFGLYLISVW